MKIKNNMRLIKLLTHVIVRIYTVICTEINKIFDKQTQKYTLISLNVVIINIILKKRNILSEDKLIYRKN